MKKNPKNSIEKLIEDIKSLKIQSATGIVEASLEVVKEEIKKGKIRTKENLNDIFFQIEQARITEPFLKNCFDYILWQIEKKEEEPFVKVVSIFNLLEDRLKTIKFQIRNNGVQLIKEGFNIFTHCHSSNVEEILKAAKEENINFTVYLTETRPKFQGRITAEKLVKSGIKVVMIPDSLAAFLISKEDKIKINLVILGTDAIFSDGSCYNKIGSYGIALSAKSAGIPLFISGSLLKFSPEKVLIEERNESEVWEKKPAGVKIFNPAFDKIPPHLINAFITEFGILKPEKIYSTVKKNYPWIMEKIKEKKQKNKILPYLFLKEKVNPKNHIIAKFKITAEGKIEEAANEVAAESSIGTWTDLTTQTQEIFKRLCAKVLEIDKKTGVSVIAYPLDLFEPGNISQLLSSVAGNIFGMKKIKWLRLLDLEFPEDYIKTFPGPQIGMEGIKKNIEIFDRPVIGCIIKPKMGLSWRQHTDLTATVFEAGVDLVKDDENLTNQDFNPFKQRVIEICSLMKKKGWVKNNQIKGKIYSFNVTAETLNMIERARFIKENGGNCAMIDIITAGFSAVSSLRKQNLGLILHGHRAMHAAFTKDKNHGISMLVIAKLARLAGIDQLHIGTVVGKMEGDKEEVIKIKDFLLSEWYGLKRTLPIASGGLHPGLVPDLIKIFGNEIVLNFGGGIHGHPSGSYNGAIAVKQAIEAVKKGINLKTYANTHQELKIALEKWG